MGCTILGVVGTLLCGVCYFFGCFLAVAPSPNSLGEALFIFRFFGLPLALYYFSLFGLCPFGNKFLIIQKKKKILCLVYFVALMLKIGTTYSSVVISQPVFG